MAEHITLFQEAEKGFGTISHGRDGKRNRLMPAREVTDLLGMNHGALLGTVLTAVRITAIRQSFPSQAAPVCSLGKKDTITIMETVLCSAQCDICRASAACASLLGGGKGMAGLCWL